MRLTGVADAGRDGYYFMCDVPGDIGIAAVKDSPLSAIALHHLFNFLFICINQKMYRNKQCGLVKP
ncbi:MAG: hypothetical protein ACYTXY_24160 [Nostoc sp.]